MLGPCAIIQAWTEACSWREVEAAANNSVNSHALRCSRQVWFYPYTHLTFLRAATCTLKAASITLPGQFLQMLASLRHFILQRNEIQAGIMDITISATEQRCYSARYTSQLQKWNGVYASNVAQRSWLKETSTLNYSFRCSSTIICRILDGNL